MNRDSHKATVLDRQHPSKATLWLRLRPASAASLLLLAMSFLLLLPAAVQAQFTYTTNNGNITITGYSGAGGAVIVPSTISGLPVTSIGDWAFNISSVTSVTLPGSITNIGYRAFNSCASLTSVTMPTGLISIGDIAFYYCTSLTNITIPASVTGIGSLPFGGCTSLRAITVDAQNVFYSSLNGVLFDKSQTTLLQFPGGKVGDYPIPGSVSNITSGAFQACVGLTSIAIPSSVNIIGDATFSECANMTSVTILGNLTSIGSFAFASCSSLTNVTIYGSAASIGFCAFQFCTSLASVTIPNGVTNIADRAFFRCYNLTNVTIPATVSWIGSFAFVSCIYMTSITVDAQNNSYSSLNGVLLNKSQTTLIQCPSGKIGSYVIPSTVVSIGNNAFTACEQLTSVIIPVSVTSIGNEAFTYCPSLIGAFFEGNVPSIGSSVFYLADNATVYYLPGTIGWGPTFGSRSTALWTLPNPLILKTGFGFGVQTNAFGFIISWATNLSVVVETCTNLFYPTWLPVSTNILTGGSSYFSDPQWTNYPTRFYRLRSP